MKLSQWLTRLWGTTPHHDSYCCGVCAAYGDLEDSDGSDD